MFPMLKPTETVFKVVFWLGYSNSCINPFIYPCSNRGFRRAFIKLLRVPLTSRRSNSSSPLCVSIRNYKSRNPTQTPPLRDSVPLQITGLNLNILLRGASLWLQEKMNTLTNKISGRSHPNRTHNSEEGNLNSVSMVIFSESTN